MSPIHDQTYRHYEGHREPPGKTWAVIAWAGIRNMLTKRAFLGLLIFAWVPFLVRAVQFYMAASLIASDRRANALQIYLSKPIRRIEYIGGKLATLMFFLLGVTFLPAM